MFFTLSKILWIFAKPSNLLIAGAVLGAVLRARRLLAAVLVVLLAAAVTPLPQWLIAPLEDRFPPPDLEQNAPDGILVLGGAVSLALSEARGQLQLNAHGERLTATASLARRYPGARIVYSGGSSELTPGGRSPARWVRAYFQAAGIDPARITTEDRARTTAENAEYSMRLVNPGPAERWLLVTSAFHMPRAVGALRQAGWNVIPYPVDYAGFPAGGGVQITWSVTGGLSIIDDAVHEYLGLAAYYATGRIDEIFPGP